MSGLRDPQWRIAQPVKHGSEPAQHQGSIGRHISNQPTMRATDPINPREVVRCRTACVSP